MDQLLKFLTSNSPAALIFAIAVLLIAITFAVMCGVAFLQGRSISLWPPAIGERSAVAAPKDKPGDMERKRPVDGASGQLNVVVDRGTVLEGAGGAAYRVLSSFYGGAQATLYKASGDDGEKVIAKVYWRGLMPNSPQWVLFQQEQRATEILSHRSIARTLDRGLYAGYPFTIIEFFSGGTLRDWMRTHDRIAGRDILSIAEQLGDAIDYAHSQGVVHRDIKPGNVLFESTPQGRVALGDFGIAVILGAVQRDITAASAGEMMGTPAYLAPELISGAVPAPSSDIYSFGVVLYEMIAKRTPFDDMVESMAMILARVNTDAPDIRTFRPDVPDRIAERLAQALQRDPSLRPESARRLLAGIEDSLASL